VAWLLVRQEGSHASQALGAQHSEGRDAVSLTRVGVTYPL
jgi:hypothetical protein